MKRNKLISRILSMMLILSLAIHIVSPPIQAAGDRTATADSTVTDEGTVAAADTNLLTGNNTNFENGVGDWAIFAGGKMEIVANPDGEGNVLKFSEPVHTWDTPSIDIRTLIQSNATKAPHVRVEMDVYSPKAMTAAVRIRTAEADDMSLTAAEGYAYVLIGRGAVSANEWTTVVSEFDLTTKDLSIDCSYWKLCLDTISKYTDTLYIDNVKLYVDDEEIVIPTANTFTRPSNTKIGATRWDAYTESTPDGSDVASQVARILSPGQYHWQVPFFANISEDGAVSFPEYTVETWEQEAAYAAKAGLDYFAYLWYDNTDAMSQPRKAHLNSEKKDMIQMCGILESIRGYATMQELFAAMKDSCYLKIEGMPVLFISSVNSWTADDVMQVRRDAVRAGISEALYIVGMIEGTYVLDATLQLGLDGLSWYGISPLESGITYQALVERCEACIGRVATSSRNNGLQMIPNFTTGMDARARIQTGASWIPGDPNATEDANKPYGNRFAYSGTSQEIAAHAGDVLNWTAANQDITQPNLVLTYAWNEHDEGGWLCPTLAVDEEGNVIYEDGVAQINDERLVELKKTIDAYRLTEDVAISTDVKVEGYQISSTLTDAAGNVGGIRVIGSVEPEINGQSVKSQGLIYALNEANGTTFDVSEDDMYIGSENAYVKSYQTTEEGLANEVMGESDTATYYVRTMTFGGSGANALSAKYSVRAYAELEDGSYVYSDVESYSIYEISDVLYQNSLMNNNLGHEFLYNNVLTVVNPDYEKVEYNWGNTVVQMGDNT